MYMLRMYDIYVSHLFTKCVYTVVYTSFIFHIRKCIVCCICIYMLRWQDDGAPEAGHDNQVGGQRSALPQLPTRIRHGNGCCVARAPGENNLCFAPPAPPCRDNRVLVLSLDVFNASLRMIHRATR